MSTSRMVPASTSLEQLVAHLAGEVLLPLRELDDHVVDGPQLIDRSLGHGSSVLTTQRHGGRSPMDGRPS